MNLSPQQAADMERFEKERGAFLNDLAMVEATVDRIAMDFILGADQRAEAAQLLVERFIDPMRLGRKPDVLRDVIRFKRRESDTGDLPAKFRSAIEHRNLLAHNMGPVVTTVPGQVSLDQRRGLGAKRTEFTLDELSAKTREVHALRERVFRLYIELFNPDALRPATEPLPSNHDLARGTSEEG